MKANFVVDGIRTTKGRDMHRIGTVFLVGLFSIFAASASADCPDGSGVGGTDYSGQACAGVCYSCNSGEVCCDGTAGADRIILAVFSGTPYAYGIIDINDDESLYDVFCCEGAAELGTTSAVYVTIEAYEDDDLICLHDSTADACENNANGLQSWEAGSYIDAGEGSDSVSTCPTFDGVDTIFGGNANDTIDSYGGADDIDGGLGRDDIDGGDEGDTIDGGDGSDFLLFGASGSDTITGGDGADIIRGGGEVDFLYGGLHDDSVHGGDEGDRLWGDDGADYLGGDDGADCICAGSTGTGNNNDGSQDTLQGDAPALGDDCYYYAGAPDYDTASLCEGALTDSNATTCDCPTS
jgi:Ca2+-binding RTX toxin-like protein